MTWPENYLPTYPPTTCLYPEYWQVGVKVWENTQFGKIKLFFWEDLNNNKDSVVKVA